MINISSRTVNLLIVLTFLIFAFLSFTGPIVEGDFFWHLLTGEWIWQNRALPATDPFSHEQCAVQTGNLRCSFILRQYWLAQLILYGLWSLYGAPGIVLFRATVYTFILTFIFFWTRRQGNLLLGLLFALLLAGLLGEFPNERPQLFTFLFTPPVIYILEQMRRGSRGLMLPPLMLIWANIHGGYVLGVAIILVYMVGEFIVHVSRKDGAGRGFFIMCLLSILITLLNPNTYKVFPLLLEKRAYYTRGVVHEYLSPLSAILRLHEYHLPYLLYLLISVVILILRFRRMEPSHILLVLMLAGLSLKGLRFMPYLLMTAPLLSGYIRWREAPIERVIVVLLIISWVITMDKGRMLRMAVDESFPKGAVEFIKRERPSGGIFNFFHWGGYLLYHLPGYRIFIDGRVLVEDRYGLYESALWSRRWGDIFRRQNIDMVLIPGMSPISGEIFPLGLNLMMDNEWFLVYMDGWSLLFLRDTDENRGIIKRMAMMKARIYDQILREANALINREPRNPGFWRAKAEALLFKGDLEGSMRCYKRVLELSPDDARVRRIMKSLNQAIPQN